MSDITRRSGYVAIVGRPNAGKSTLLNALSGQKISITSRRPQTTRSNVSGIVTRAAEQFVFLDTPGWQTEHQSALTRAMERSLRNAIATAHAVVWLKDVTARVHYDDDLYHHLKGSANLIVALNKIDEIANKNQLLTLIASLDAAYHPRAIVPVSALNHLQLDTLLDALAPCLPEQGFLYAEDQVTTANIRELAGEMVREKLFRLLGQELPYSTAVEIESYEETPELTRIGAVILVDKPGQKAIVIGKGGEKLKAIGSAARRDIETLTGGKVFLKLWVKVKHAWADDHRTLARLGLT
jgi:GTP-binding protein Era